MDENRMQEIEEILNAKFAHDHGVYSNFIHRARTDIPALIAALRDERATNARLLEYITALVSAMPPGQFCALVDAGKVDGIRAYMEGVA